MVAISRISTQQKVSVIRPGFAVVFHQDSESSNIVCATRHRINPETNTLSIGTVLSASQVAKTFSELRIDKEKIKFECIPENVIFNSDQLIVWYKRRFIGDMWFRIGEKPQRLVVEWPPLLFAALKNKAAMHVFALGKNTRPTEKSILYHAPLMNINKQGLLCQGTAKLPHDISIASIAECESTLFDSQFTHVNHENTFSHKTNSQKHFLYWKSKSRNKKRDTVRINSKEMSPTGHTLLELIKEQLNG